MPDAINGDLAVRAVQDTEQMDWSPSPSGTVWRKRVHLVGSPESGQVTSIVRYEPDSSFPAHDHPQGEEILVLDGVFCDEHGDWPTGTYLLNPEGFRHAPFSSKGCKLFVKLRQFPGKERRHVVIDTHSRPWEHGPDQDVALKHLYRQAGFEDETWLERWLPDAALRRRFYERGAELFVLNGAFADDEGEYSQGTWLRFPAGAQHQPRTSSGCTLYVKTGGLTYLIASDE